MSNTEQPESRLGLDDVSGEISRIFFSKGVQSGNPVTVMDINLLVLDMEFLRDLFWMIMDLAL